MKKHEASISHKVARWFLHSADKSYPFEVKHTRGNVSFSLAEISKHQKLYLEAATTERGFIYKIVDANMGYTPFDYMMYKNTKAFVIVVFPTYVCAIPIETILTYITHEQKSITEDEARAVSSYKTKVKEL